MGLFQSKPIANNDSLQKVEDDKSIADTSDMIISNEESKSAEISEPTYTEEFKYEDEITPRAIHSNTCTYTVVEEFNSQETDVDNILVKTEETVSTEELCPAEEAVATERTFSTEELCTAEEVVATERTFSREETCPAEEKCVVEENKKKKRSKRNRMR
jgi:hypothetical protein